MGRRRRLMKKTLLLLFLPLFMACGHPVQGTVVSKQLVESREVETVTPIMPGGGTIIFLHGRSTRGPYYKVTVRDNERRLHHLWVSKKRYRSAVIGEHFAN
jgi:hypothetical protein